MKIKQKKKQITRMIYFFFYWPNQPTTAERCSKVYTKQAELPCGGNGDVGGEEVAEEGEAKVGSPAIPQWVLCTSDTGKVDTANMADTAGTAGKGSSTGNTGGT